MLGKYRVFICMFFAVGCLWGQEPGRIYYAAGSEFILSSGSERTLYRPENIGGEGLPFGPGDVVQTPADGRLEIRFASGVVKLGENTSFAFAGNGPAFNLVYGRARLAGLNGVTLKAGEIAGDGPSIDARGGDTGVDYLIVPGGQRPTLRVYAFSGPAAIRLAGRGGPLTAAQGEAVIVESRPSYTYVERRTLGADITAYWNMNGVSSPVSAQAVDPAGKAQNAARPALNDGLEFMLYQPKDTSRTQRIAARWVLFGLGSLAATAGLAMQGVGIAGHYSGAAIPNNFDLMLYGSAAQTAGFLSFLSAFLIQVPPDAAK